MTASPTAARPVRTALCTVLNDDFLLGFIALAHTFKAHHPELNLPFVIFHNHTLSTLSDESQRLIHTVYPAAVFKEVSDADYATIWAHRDGPLQTPDRLKPAFFILEAFNLRDYDRVITLDSDMLFTGPIHELLALECDFGATQAYDYEKAVHLNYFNSGVMVIGPAHLTGKTYQALLTHTLSPDYDNKKGKADQAILNDYFRLADIAIIPERFNVTKRKFPDKQIHDINAVLSGDTRILHFVGDKPWQLHLSRKELGYEILETYWEEQLQSEISGKELIKYIRLLQFKLAAHGSSLDAGARALKDRKERIAELRRITTEVDAFVEKLISTLKAAAKKKGPSLKRPDKWLGHLINPRKAQTQGFLAILQQSRREWLRQSKRLEKHIKEPAAPRPDAAKAGGPKPRA